jgi:hypothetical protein
VALVSGPLLRLIPAWAGSAPTAPRPPLFVASLRDAIAWSASIPVLKLTWALGVVFFLVFVRRLVRVEWLAAVIVTLLFSASYLGLDLPVLASGLFATGLLVFVTIRCGLLAALTLAIVTDTLRSFVTTTDTSAWYFYLGPIAIAAVLGLALWGFRMATPRALTAAPA